MNDSDLDHSVIDQMQKDCQLGLSVAEIVQRAQASLGPKGRHTLVILRHFMVAFGLSLKDARMLEGCPILGGSAFSRAVRHSLTYEASQVAKRAVPEVIPALSFFIFDLLNRFNLCLGHAERCVRPCG